MRELNTPAEKMQPMKLAVKFKGKRKTKFPDEKEIKIEEDEKEEEKEEEKEQVQTDTETSEEEQSEEGEQESEEEEEEEEEGDEETGDDEALGEDDVEAFVRQMEEEAANEMESEPQEKKELSKEEMNARRLAALEAKQQRKKEEKVVIPAIGEAVGNKKITFDDSGNEQEPEEKEEEGGVVSNWMDSSDDEDEGEQGLGKRKTFDFTDGDNADAAADAEAQAAFALRPEFVGEKGKKLFEMQKRFGGDSRFRLDARFLEEEANEYGGNDVEEEDEKEIDEEAIAELQSFLEEENPEEAAWHAREMREEEEAALRVVSKLFPDVDVTHLQRRMQEQRAPKDPLKEAAWMGELKRYDPRDVYACREFEIPMTSASSGVQMEEEAVTASTKREEKEIPTGGDRFFSTTGDLSNLFSRVRKNSEDGEEGEAALDGVFGFGAAATETGSEAPFKLSSLFSFPVGEDKPLAAMGEQLLEDEQEQHDETPAGDWAFSQGFHPTDDHDEAMATDSEAGDDAEADEDQDKAALTKKRAKKSLEDFLAFGRTFIGGEEVQDWPERRKKLTLDYKRKRRDAVKMKKRKNKQQSKANKAKADASTTGTGPSKWKKARL
ncbi:unnamed protein product [Phytophthora lilii]|uniref:Unnamed protein product n=1 Tax=Phytophthora lilii TaxID=2077276 RepID=A0A9W6U5N0_9STRA|nr:unnamed protein product [Phytophthora lilii]